MNIWNDKNLGFPPINTYKATNKDLDLQRLYSRCMEARTFFLDEKFMYAEHLILSRIIYRMKQKFRSAKDFKTLAKLHKALNNYFQMHIGKDLQTYAGVIPSRYKSETYLPNKNLLDYILLKLQGIAKLMERIVETSQIAASMLEQRLSIGHFWKMMIILFAIVSRIHVLAKYTANHVCEHYRKLYPFSLQMKNNGASILPDGYEMCEDLKKWLNVDWLDFEDDLQILDESPEMSIIQYFNLADDDDDDDDDEDIKVSDEYIIVADEDPDELEIVNSFKRLSRINLRKKNEESIKELRGFNQEDIGEVIELVDETITSSLCDGEQDDSGQFDQSESLVEVVNITDSIIETQSEEDSEDVVNISDVTISESSDHFNMTKSSKNIVKTVGDADETNNKEAEDVGEVVDVLNTHISKENSHQSNVLCATDTNNFSIVEINDTIESSVNGIVEENQQNVDTSIDDLNADIGEAFVIDDSTIIDQAEDVGEIDKCHTSETDAVADDEDILIISDTELKERSAVRKSTLRILNKSVNLKLNRKTKRSSVNRLIETIEKDKKDPPKKALKRKRKRSTNQTNDVIEVDSLSDSSVIIVDEFRKTESKRKSNLAKVKQKKKKKKLEEHKTENNPPQVSLKINSKKKGKKPKKKNKQPASNPNTNFNAKAPGSSTKAKGKGVQEHLKINGGKPTNNPNMNSNNSNNRNLKTPNVSGTSRKSIKAKKLIKLGKAVEEHLKINWRKPASNPNTNSNNSNNRNVKTPNLPGTSRKSIKAKKRITPGKAIEEHLKINWGKPASSPNTNSNNSNNQNLKTPNVSGTSRKSIKAKKRIKSGNAVEEHLKINWGKPASNPNANSNNSNNRNVKTPIVPGTSRKSIKAKRRMKFGKAVEEHPKINWGNPASNPNTNSNNPNNQNLKTHNIPGTPIFTKRKKQRKSVEEHLKAKGTKRKFEQVNSPTIGEVKKMKLNSKNKKRKRDAQKLNKTMTHLVRPEIQDYKPKGFKNINVVKTNVNKRKERKRKRLEYRFKRA